MVGDRLVEGAYQPVELVDMGLGHLHGHSEVLNLDLCWDNGRLRWWDPAAQRYLLTFDEEHDEARIAEAEARANAEARIKAEARIRELEAELERRRGDLIDSAQPTPSAVLFENVPDVCRCISNLASLGRALPPWTECPAHRIRYKHSLIAPARERSY